MHTKGFMYQNTKESDINLNALFLKKRLSLQSWENTSSSLTLSSDISTHAAWAFEHIYNIPFPYSKSNTKFARETHGIQHASRVALYVMVLANLYAKYSNKETSTLTIEEVKLLQIGALFHDSGREILSYC